MSYKYIGPFHLALEYDVKTQTVYDTYTKKPLTKTLWAKYQPMFFTDAIFSPQPHNRTMRQVPGSDNDAVFLEGIKLLNKI